MNSLQHRVFGIALLVALVAAGGTASADDLPSPDELSEMEGADVDELREEDDDEESDAAQAEGESDEASEREESDEDQADDETVAQGDEEVDEDWETPLRDPISPVLNQEGSLGFHGIASALSPGPMKFQVGLLGQASGGQNFIRHNDEHGFWAGSVLVNSSINEYFGAHLGIEARNNVNTFGRPQAMLSQGDLNLGATGRYEVHDGISLGGDLSLFIPSSFGGVGFEVPSTSVRPRLLASFDIDQIAGAQDDTYVPVIAHANIGYRVDNTENLVGQDSQIDRIERHAYGISAYDAVELGLGAEFPLPYVTPFLGWQLGIPVNATGDVCADDRALECVSEVGASAFPQKLSIGAKGEPVNNLGLHLGMDIGLTGAQAEGLPATIPYEFHFGISWNIDPSAGAEPELQEVEVEVEPERGLLEGVVVDRQSGEPVEGARITYLDLEVNEQLTAAESGRFQSYEFHPGEELALEVSHPNYEMESVAWQVEEGRAEREISLEPIPQQGRLAGTVLDGEQEPVGSARIIARSDAGEITEVQTDADGTFELEVDGGGINLAAVADGYLTVGAYLEVEAGSEQQTELSLRRVEERQATLGETEIDFDGSLQFESDDARLLEDSSELLDHLAAVVLENPEIGLVEIQGHTDDAGDDDDLLMMSQQRSEAVVDALVERGVSPERLEAEGYGATQPILPNTSSRNRAMNRRMEFHLVE